MMHLDGSGLTQLTKGPVDMFPQCTPDGKWLFYSDNRYPSGPLLMRKPLQGGAAQLVMAASVWYDVSPDGKFLVTGPVGNITPLQIVSTGSLQVVRSLSPRDYGPFAFSGDGKSVFYAIKTGADTTIWRQPLDTTTPVKVVTLAGKHVGWIRVSPDGKKLGLIVATPTSEAVLLRDVH
jgi:Tol biopolymer transport system component